MLIAIQ